MSFWTGPSLRPDRWRTSGLLGQHRRHGVSLQVITALDGTLVWVSPTLASWVHDLTAARWHRIIATCVRLGYPVLADRAYRGAGDNVAAPTAGDRAQTSRSNRGASTGPTPYSAGRSGEPSPESRPGGSSAKSAAAPAAWRPSPAILTLETHR